MKKQNKWDQVTIFWDCGTDAIITKESLEKVSIYSITVQNTPDHKAVISLRMSIPIDSTIRFEVTKIFMSFNLHNIKPYVNEEYRSSNYFQILFDLPNGINFSDIAIEAVRYIFEEFSIVGQWSDGGGTKKRNHDHLLSNFVIFRQTLVKVKGAWIMFDDYLRNKHKLLENPLTSTFFKIGPLQVKMEINDDQPFGRMPTF